MHQRCGANCYPLLSFIFYPHLQGSRMSRAQDPWMVLLPWNGRGKFLLIVGVYVANYPSRVPKSMENLQNLNIVLILKKQ